METMALGMGQLAWQLKVHQAVLFQVVALELVTTALSYKILRPSVQTAVNSNLLSLNETNQLPPITSRELTISRVNPNSFNRATYRSRWVLDLRISQVATITIQHKGLGQESQVPRSLRKLILVLWAKGETMVEVEVGSRASSKGLSIKTIRLIKTTIMTLAATTVSALNNKTVRVLGVQATQSSVRPTMAARRV